MLYTTKCCVIFTLPSGWCMLVGLLHYSLQSQHSPGPYLTNRILKYSVIFPLMI